MKTYTKKHTNLKAALAHRTKIKNRGGDSSMVEEDRVYTVTYEFPDKQSSKTNTKKSVAKRKLYDVLSPDGLTIRKGVPPFRTMTERADYYSHWVEPHQSKGYYLSPKYGPIPREILALACAWIEW